MAYLDTFLVDKDVYAQESILAPKGSYVDDDAQMRRYTKPRVLTKLV